MCIGLVMLEHTSQLSGLFQCTLNITAVNKRSNTGHDQIVA